ncbi:MAG: aminoglycoside adenylyltransferase domain-containing protein [Gemmatimonadaceae bacterium]
MLRPITPRMVFAALVRELEYLRAEIQNPQSRWRAQRFYRAYAVMTLCRILYTHRLGDVVSKPRAARWALRAVPHRWHALIRAAWSGSRTTERALPLPRIARFIDYAGAQLDDAAAIGVDNEQRANRPPEL